VPIHAQLPGKRKIHEQHEGIFQGSHLPMLTVASPVAVNEHLPIHAGLVNYCWEDLVGSNKAKAERA
jgi:hypothetical protein